MSKMKDYGAIVAKGRAGPALVTLALFLLSACASKGTPIAAGDGGTPVDAGVKPFDRASLARAADLRRSKDVAEGARTSHDVELRREAARALARIADGDSVEGLMRALEDGDRTTAAWGAYGLGTACRGREDANVRALAARAATFGEDAGPVDTARDGIDVRVAIARAIGRCGGGMAEKVLTSWVRRRDVLGASAAYALGDVAKRRGALGDEAMAALLDAASPGPGTPGLEAALYPFSRLERVPEAFAARVTKAAQAGLSAGQGTARWFAVKALGQIGPSAVEPLEKIVLDRTFSPAERASAASALRLLGDEGHAAAADALAQLAPGREAKDALELLRVAGDDYGILISLVVALGAEVPKKNEPALYALASLTAPGSPPGSLARRLAELRCGAAAALARGAYDSDVLRKCDADTSEAYERARLASLLRRSLVGERRAAWRALSRSDHVKVREAALEAIADHPELGDTARAALAEALSSKKGGIVGTAAEIVHAHPDRVLVLSEKERRAALDPSSPPPTASPARSLDPAVASALGAADRKSVV